MELDLGNVVDTVTVMLPIPAPRPYSYAVPQGMQLAPGDFVQVPLGPRLVAAVVWDEPDDEQAVDPKKLRTGRIQIRLPTPRTGNEKIC